MLILAPSGSGKSHYVKSPEAKGRGNKIVDGDKLVTWPKQHRWWEKPKLKERVHESTTSEIAKYIRENPDHVVLWNGDVSLLVRKVRGPIIAVLPGDKELERNARARTETQRKLGKLGVQPNTLKELIGGRNRLKALTQVYHIPTARDFQTAIEILGVNNPFD